MQTQVISEGTKPDFVGYDAEGNKRLIGESKFWANLVGGQPNDYFDQLPEEGPGVVLFVAPRARIETLWHELQRTVGQGLGPSTESRDTPSARLEGTEKLLMLVGWDHLLSEIARQAALEPHVQSDVQQLRGLTERMDEEAFLPLHDNELSPEVIKRFQHFQALAIKSIDRGRREGWITDVANNTSRWTGGYGRRFRLTGIKAKAWFGLDGDTWARRGNSPMWLKLEGITPEILSEVYTGSDLHIRNNWLYVPIFLKTRAEEAEVLDDIVHQLKDIADAIKEATVES